MIAQSPMGNVVLSAYNDILSLIEDADNSLHSSYADPAYRFKCLYESLRNFNNITLQLYSNSKQYNENTVSNYSHSFYEINSFTDYRNEGSKASAALKNLKLALDVITAEKITKEDIFYYKECGLANSLDSNQKDKHKNGKSASTQMKMFN